MRPRRPRGRSGSGRVPLRAVTASSTSGRRTGCRSRSVRMWSKWRDCGGLIRYALAPGEPGIDLDQYWRKRDPSWHFVMARLRGVHPNDVDRVIDEAVDDLLDSPIPLSQHT